MQTGMGSANRDVLCRKTGVLPDTVTRGGEKLFVGVEPASRQEFRSREVQTAVMACFRLCK